MTLSVEEREKQYGKQADKIKKEAERIEKSVKKETNQKRLYQKMALLRKLLASYRELEKEMMNDHELQEKIRLSKEGGGWQQ